MAPCGRVIGVDPIDASLTRAHRDALTGVACLTVRGRPAGGGASTPSSVVAASTSRDGTLKLSALDLPSTSTSRTPRWFAPKRTVAAPARAALSCVCLTPDGAFAVCGGLDAALVAFHVADGRPAGRVTDAHDAPISACAAGVSSSRGAGVVDVATAGLDAAVKVWAFDTTLRGRPDDGRRPGGASDHHHHHGASSLLIPPDAVPVLELYDHEAPSAAVALRSDARLVAAGADDGAVIVWDARDTSGQTLASNVLARVELDDSIAAVCVDVVSSVGGWGDRVFAADRSGLVLEFDINGVSMRRVHVHDHVSALVVIDARPVSSSSSSSGADSTTAKTSATSKMPELHGPYVVAAVGDGDLAVFDWDHKTAQRPQLVDRRNGHASTVAALGLVRPPESGDASSDRGGRGLETYVVSAAEDCTLKAWRILREDEGGDDGDDADPGDDDDDGETLGGLGMAGRRG